MIEQISTAIDFRAHYTNAGASATGLTVTVDVYNPAGTKTIAAASATEIGTSGVYEYTLTSGNTGTEGLYTAIFTTAGTVDQADIAGQWHVGVAAVENLDAAVSSRLSTAGYTVPPTAAAITDAVWDEAMSGHTTAGTTGRELYDQNTLIPGLVTGQTTISNQITTQINGLATAIPTLVWDELTSAHVIAGSTGAALTTSSTSDPLANNLGTYTAGTAGNALQRLTKAVVAVTLQYTNTKLELIIGEDYTGEGVAAITITGVDGFTLSGGTVDLYVSGVVVGSATAVQSGDSAVITMTIARAETSLWTCGVNQGAIIFTDGSGDLHTLARLSVQYLDASVAV